jgi:drug/metabolite transporter (DMT)-like permease
MSPKTRADLALVSMAFIWGVSFVVMKEALNAASTVLLLALRFTLAAVLLACVRRTLQPSRSNWASLAGLLLAIAFVLQTAGLRLTSASKAGFLTGLYIAVVPLLSWIVYKNAPQIREWAGIGTACAGMALMTWDGTALRAGSGEILTVGCAIVFAGHLLTVDRAVRDVDPMEVGWWQIAVCSLLLWLALPVIETPRITWSWAMAGTLAVTAILATAMPFTLMAWAQQHTTPVRTGLLLSLEMPFAALAGWLVLGERFTQASAAGAALILAGILLVELKPSSRGAHP